MYNIEITNPMNVDKGGYLNLAKISKKIECDGKTWTYEASGFARDVYVSDCGDFVIKIPKMEIHFEHNKHEFNVYNDAPDYCKERIAECRLLPNGYLIQERLKIAESNIYYRELGYRKDDDIPVIFDCDIFLNYSFEKPENGYKYEEVFSVDNTFGTREIVKQIKIERRQEQRRNVKKYSPNIEKQTFYCKNGKTYIDGVKVDEKIAKLCGF